MAGHYRRFCRICSITAEPLTNLLCEKLKFVWSGRRQQVFNKLKALLGNTLVLLAPDFNKSFKLTGDASDIGIDALRLQEDDKYRSS